MTATLSQTAFPLCTPTSSRITRKILGNYGEFLPDTFFTEHANSYVMNTIRPRHSGYDKAFRILNDIYENGTNDTQSLVAVTILGEMNNDRLCSRMQTHICATMRDTVYSRRKFWPPAAAKSSVRKLKNPPPAAKEKERRYYVAACRP